LGQDFRSSDLKDVKIHIVPLGEGIKGFVYVSRKDVPHVFISDSLSPECAMETLAHELYHLKDNKQSHGVGLDRQHEESELKANKFASLNRHRILALMNSGICAILLTISN